MSTKFHINLANRGLWGSVSKSCRSSPRAAILLPCTHRAQAQPPARWRQQQTGFLAPAQQPSLLEAPRSTEQPFSLHKVQLIQRHRNLKKIFREHNQLMSFKSWPLFWTLNCAHCASSTTKATQQILQVRDVWFFLLLLFNPALSKQTSIQIARDPDSNSTRCQLFHTKMHETPQLMGLREAFSKSP